MGWGRRVLWGPGRPSVRRVLVVTMILIVLAGAASELIHRLPG
jgi:hypothetical protein